MKRILIVQTSFLGDVILSTPTIAAISKKHPNSEIWMLTTPAACGLVSSDPLIKQVITFDKKGKERSLFGLFKKANELRNYKFDIVYSLHKSARTSLLLKLSGIPNRIGFKESKLSFLYSEVRKRAIAEHDVLRNLSLVGDGPWDESDLSLRITKKSKEEISEIKSKFNITKPYAVLAPGSAWYTKMWRPAGFREVGEKLKSFGLEVVVIGGSNDFDVCTQVAANSTMINLSNKTTLTELVSIIQGSNLLICNDSMPLHLASALKIPTVVVFCATSPAFGFGPWRNQSVVIEASDLACKPCSRHGTKKCPNRTEACMKQVTSEMVYGAATKLLQ